MVLLMNTEDWEGAGMSESEKNKEEDKKEKVCKCGHAVCCGKHKKGQCSCQRSQRERS